MKTRSLLCAPILIGIMLTAGCVSTPTIPVNIQDPYTLGRLSAIAYMTQKEKLDPKYVKALETVYTTFNALVDASGDQAGFKNLIMVSLQATDMNTTDTILLTEVVDLYWDQFEANYNLSTLIGIERIAVFHAFNEGVKKALDDYSKILARE